VGGVQAGSHPRNAVMMCEEVNGLCPSMTYKLGLQGRAFTRSSRRLVHPVLLAPTAGLEPQSADVVLELASHQVGEFGTEGCRHPVER